jgi:TolB-like protein/DNA-binding winged helix-turn-helix (wHTH) protein/Tfp pilus assembly protein PilF
MSKPDRNTYEFGPFRLDAEQHLLMRGDEPVPLPPKAFETLLLLVRDSGRVLQKKELMESLWPNSFVEEANLTQNIFLLRKALGEDSGEYIKTVPRVGYRFVAPVREVRDEEEALVAASHSRQRIVVHEEVVEHEEDAPERAYPLASSHAAPRRISTAFFIIGAFLLATIIGGGIWLVSRARNAKVDAGTGPAIDSIAVLPFSNQAGDADSEYLSDGITESLINSLTQLKGLRVIPRTTVFHYKSREVDPQSAGRDLKVRAVLVGRVFQHADTVSIQTELIDIDTESQLWGAQYNRKLSDLLAIQEDIAKEISGKLRLKLSGDEQKQLAKRYTDNIEAYQLYLKGRYNATKYTPEGVNKAIECFNKAIAIDPNYALAYDGLAYCYYAADWWDYPAKESMAKGRAFAAKALEIDPQLAEAHTSLGIIHMWLDYDWPAAEKELNRALELNPNYASAHLWRGFLSLTAERFDESIAEGKRAVELDPLSPEANSSLGVYLFYARRYDEALQQLRTTVELEPHYWFAHIYLARVFERKGQIPAAIEELEKAKRMEGAAWEVWSALGYAYAISGRRAEAQKVINELKENKEKRSWLYPYYLATIYAGLGEKDQAFAYLKKEFDEGAYYLNYLRVDPELDNLRSDPRFAILVRRVGLAP